MPEPERTIRIEVAWALPERQLLIALEVPDGTTVRDAVVRAGIDPAPAKFGLFGKVVVAEHALRDGDRVDVLRPLRADPKEVRRALAAQGKTMGRKNA